MYITVIVPVVYGCETCVISAEEHRLTVSVNRVLRGIFGVKEEELTRGWRKLLNPFGAGIFFKILAHPVFKM